MPRSLSAGSDLDKLKLLSDQTGGKINSLVNLTSVASSPHTARRLSTTNCSSPLTVTESIQSINKLADSVENLREKLTTHPGLIFFPMTKKEQLLEELLDHQMPMPPEAVPAAAPAPRYPHPGLPLTASDAN